MTHLCACGCGLPTNIVKTHARGMRPGEYFKYLRGHATGRHETDPAKQTAKDLAGRRRYKAEQKERMKIHVRGYLSDHPCIDCGEKDPVVLDFDHRDPVEKHRGISQIIGWALGIKVLIAEIAKCDVRCANCHRRRHYQEMH